MLNSQHDPIYEWGHIERRDIFIQIWVELQVFIKIWKLLKNEVGIKFTKKRREVICICIDIACKQTW